MPEDEVLVQRDGAILFVTFNRPHARNALTWSMYDQLLAICDEADEDEAVRVVVFRGAGEAAFVAGTDIGQFAAFETAEDALAYERRIDRVLDRLERVGKPTIALLRGATVGGGAALALACDLRYAAPDLRFGLPIARTLGNCLSMSNYARLADAVGPARAKEMVMRARLIDASEAERLGVVSEVVPAEQLEGRVREVAAELMQMAPLTLRATKEALRRIAVTRRLAPGAGDDLIVMCYMSEDFRNAVRAFLEKRPHTWTGR